MLKSTIRPSRLVAMLLTFAGAAAGAASNDGGSSQTPAGAVTGLVMPRVFTRPQVAVAAAAAESAFRPDAKKSVNAIYEKTTTDGAIELTNVSEGDGYSQLAIDEPLGASGVSDTPSRVLVPAGVLPVAQEADAPAAAQAPVADADAALRGGSDSSGAGSDSTSDPHKPAGGYITYAGINTVSSGGGAFSMPGGAATPVLSPAGTSGSSPGKTGSDPGPKTVVASDPAPAPIAWPGSIAASDVKDPYLAAKLPTIGANLAAIGNPAIGRRYLMIDRNTYLALYGGVK